ncbi:hypothetical protein LTR40_002774 [Exophiala xenobiotica]|nr:hypothetical protein LTR40_002774 [Exophiala xenobiotica]
MVIEDSPEPTFRLVKAPEVIVIEDSPEPPVHDEDIPKQSCEKDEEPNPMLNVWFLSVSTEEDSVF